MASIGNSYSDRISRWKVLITKTRDEVAPIPQLAVLHSELESLLTQVEDLEIQQGGMRANLQELNKKRIQILGDGEGLRTAGGRSSGHARLRQRTAPRVRDPAAAQPATQVADS